MMYTDLLVHFTLWGRCAMPRVPLLWLFPPAWKAAQQYRCMRRELSSRAAFVKATKHRGPVSMRALSLQSQAVQRSNSTSQAREPMIDFTAPAEAF